MPSRLLREGIIDSQAVNSLSLGGEVFYRRLMSVVDDFGRFDGRPAVLRARLYPLRLDTVTDADVGGWLRECVAAGLIEAYEAGGKPYLLFLKLGPARSKASKYPAPPPDGRVKTSVNGCARVKTDASVRSQPLAGENGCAHMRPYSDSYSGSGAGSGSAREDGPPADPYPAIPADGTEDDPGKPPPDPEPEIALAAADPPDPLREAERQRKLFCERWAAAGLRPFGRLTQTLQSRLSHLLGVDGWAEEYPRALAHAGRVAFLRDGLNRQKGPLNPREFLGDDDFAASILRGEHDDRPRPPRPNTRSPPASAGAADPSGTWVGPDRGKYVPPPPMPPPPPKGDSCQPI